MLGAIREFFEKYAQDASAENGPAHDPLHIATAALLADMMRMSGETTAAERERVLNALQVKFGLSTEALAPLLHRAEQEVQQATDYYRFTALIKNRFTAAQRERLIEHMWAVAYADGTLHRYEEHLVRKIADLLYVPHKVFIAAKLRARDAMR